MSSGILHRVRAIVEFGAALSIVVIGIVVVWPLLRPVEVRTTVTGDPPGPRPVPVPSDSISLERAFVKGDPAAKVVIVEYADLQCPACIRFANETLKPLIAKHVDTGRVRFAFRHFPLPNHPMARPAAIAAQCAGEQGKFWQFSERLFQASPKLDEAFLQSSVTSLALDRSVWSRCRKTDAAAALVQRDFEEARKLKLRATPAFLIGTIDGSGQFRATAALYGAQSLAEFDAAIAQAEKGLASAKR